MRRALGVSARVSGEAIKLVFGTAERGVELPMVDETSKPSAAACTSSESSEGMGLIRNAVARGDRPLITLRLRDGGAGTGSTMPSSWARSLRHQRDAPLDGSWMPASFARARVARGYRSCTILGRRSP